MHRSMVALQKFLLGRRRDRCLTIEGTANLAEFPELLNMPRWKYPRRDSTVAEVLSVYPKEMQDELDTVLGTLGVSKERHLSLPGNPRKIMGLEIAKLKGPRVLIFDVSGCDPKGVNAAYEWINLNCPDIGAVEISRGHHSRNQVFYHQHPRAERLNLTVHPQCRRSNQVRVERMTSDRIERYEALQRRIDTYRAPSRSAAQNTTPRSDRDSGES
jgi:hypothetical protein